MIKVVCATTPARYRVQTRAHHPVCSADMDFLKSVKLLKKLRCCELKLSPRKVPRILTELSVELWDFLWNLPREQFYFTPPAAFAQFITQTWNLQPFEIYFKVIEVVVGSTVPLKTHPEGRLTRDIELSRLPFSSANTVICGSSTFLARGEYLFPPHMRQNP